MPTFCNLKRFEQKYAATHVPLSFFVCIFGSVANILNICVLTTKEMRWPTNLILTALAVADMLVMFEYMPYSLFRYLNDPKSIAFYSYNSAAYLAFHAVFSQIFHFISCCLTVLLAVWRYIIITSPQRTRTVCNMQKTLVVIIVTYVLCPLICLPFYFVLEIRAYNHTATPNGRLIDRNDVLSYAGLTENRTIYHVDYNVKNQVLILWMYGVILKLVPCVLLTHLSWRLISVLIETKHRRQLLINSSSLPMNDCNSMRPILHKKIDKDNRQADRTSSMLVAVLLLFLITEFPQAILGLLSAILGKQFQRECYQPLGDLMDILALINSAINFILYCNFGRRFVKCSIRKCSANGYRSRSNNQTLRKMERRNCRTYSISLSTQTVN